MNVELLFYIRKNPLLHHYLKYHSYWYKELYRNPSSIKNMEQEMKKEYKLTFEDRMNSFTDKINLISNFLEVMK